MKDIKIVEKMYCITIDEGHGEKVVWFSIKREKTGRKFFFGGTGLICCIFPNPNYAHAFSKKEKVLDDFEKDAQLYVRPIKEIIFKS